MPSNFSKVGFQERPAVIMTPGSDGMMHADSLASVMNMRMQRMVYERELAKSRPQRTLETQHQDRRQVNLERALEKVRKIDLANGRDTDPRFRIAGVKGEMVAPLLSSPQPLFSLRNTPKDKLESKRTEQIQNLNTHSFVAVALPKLNAIIDKAIALSDDREKEVLARVNSKKNLFGNLKKKADGATTTVSATDWLYITSPLDDAIDRTNAGLERSDLPIRLHFRKVWETPEQLVPRLYMIYPNTDLDYKDGPKTWEGIGEAVDRHGNSVF